MPKLLAVDDDRAVLHLITRAFEETDTAVLAARDGQSALALLETTEPDVVLLDVMLPDASGLDLFSQIQNIDPKLPVIFVTAVGDAGTAIEAMKRGAFDYLRKPFDVFRVRELVERAAEVRRQMKVPIHWEANKPKEGDQGDQLVGHSPEMLEVYKLIGQAAPQNIAVLIRGESGTGKEMIARAVYQHSTRADKPFLAINCAAIPEALLESELFGHEKGAFTSADSRRIGKFEQCSGGTIFLDEIGDMPIPLQSKILRLLQEQRFERVGGTQTISTDVRIIAATNRDLESMISSGDFREDLYYRLNGLTISLPPLRERVADIEPLLNYFLSRFSMEFGKEIAQFSDEALRLLKSYSWPGNVREMQSVLKRAILRAKGRVLTQDFFPEEIRDPAATPAALAGDGDETGLPPSDLAPFIEKRLKEDSESLYAEAVEALEAYLLSRVLRETSGNQSQAARILGITRGSLRKKIAAAGISLSRTISVED